MHDLFCRHLWLVCCLLENLCTAVRQASCRRLWIERHSPIYSNHPQRSFHALSFLVVLENLKFTTTIKLCSTNKIFRSLWNSKPGSPEDYFKPEYVERTCKACKEVGGLDYDNCKNDQSGVRDYCKMTMKEMHAKFEAAFEGGGGGSSQ